VVSGSQFSPLGPIEGIRTSLPSSLIEIERIVAVEPSGSLTPSRLDRSMFPFSSGAGM
jgi:hypothetical protein